MGEFTRKGECPISESNPHTRIKNFAVATPRVQTLVHKKRSENTRCNTKACQSWAVSHSNWLNRSPMLVLHQRGTSPSQQNLGVWSNHCRRDTVTIRPRWNGRPAAFICPASYPLIGWYGQDEKRHVFYYSRKITSGSFVCRAYLGPERRWIERINSGRGWGVAWVAESNLIPLCRHHIGQFFWPPDCTFPDTH